MVWAAGGNGNTSLYVLAMQIEDAAKQRVLLLVSKSAAPMTVDIKGAAAPALLAGGDTSTSTSTSTSASSRSSPPPKAPTYTVLDGGREHPGWNPPITGQLKTDGLLLLGPFAVALVVL